MFKKYPRLAVIGLSTLGLLMATASAETAPTKPLSPQAEQAKELALQMKGAMEEMITAIEKTTDEASAKEAATAIINSSGKIKKLAVSGRELQAKLTEEDKQQLASMEKQFMDANFQERFAAAFMGLAGKPELMKILEPAMRTFSAAAMSMAAGQAGDDEVIRARDKGLPPRNRNQAVPPQDKAPLVE